MSWDNPIFPIHTKNSIVFFLYNFFGLVGDSVKKQSENKNISGLGEVMWFQFRFGIHKCPLEPLANPRGDFKAYKVTISNTFVPLTHRRQGDERWLHLIFDFLLFSWGNLFGTRDIWQQLAFDPFRSHGTFVARTLEGLKIQRSK